VAIHTYKLLFAGKDSSAHIMSLPLNTSLSKFAKNAYIGGRTEVFDSGINLSPIYHFDVPGMYALCIQKDLPVGNAVYVGDFEDNVDIGK
jgi:hypothetical protein